MVAVNGAFESWIDHESEILMNGITALIKDIMWGCTVTWKGPSLDGMATWSHIASLQICENEISVAQTLLGLWYCEKTNSMPR